MIDDRPSVGYRRPGGHFGSALESSPIVVVLVVAVVVAVVVGINVSVPFNSTTVRRTPQKKRAS